MSALTRTLKLGSYGKDVEACKRAVHRFLQTHELDKLEAQPVTVRRTYGPFFRTLVKQAQKQGGILQTGSIGARTERVLRDARAFDALADHLLDQYQREQAPPVIELVQPTQGFASLHRSLWELYSIGRHAGLSDLGTFNGASRLPSGRPSDHAVYPAYAFDLGFTPHTGYEHPTARAFFKTCCERPEVEYCILGDHIWSRAQGLHTYTAGGHANHVHVSGNR
jgi:hypothetical protein